jgi:hypothetical protein
MKKVISVLVIMAVFSTAVFAAPLSIAGSLDISSREVSRTELASKTEGFSEFDDLFADVQAVALTTEEAQAVEGEGFWGAVIGGIVGAVSSTAVFIGNVITNPPKTPGDVWSTVGQGILGIGTTTLGGIGAGYKYIPL